MPSISVDISSGADNAFTGIIPTIPQTQQYLNSGFIQAGHKYNAGLHFNFIDIAGFRFQTINIPQGATISDAALTFVTRVSRGTPNITIYGNDVDDAGAWGTTNRVKDISKTAASASLVAAPAHANSVNDVTAIVQEIVDRGGWSSNNNMAFGLFDQAGTGNNVWYGVGYNYTASHTYYGATANPANLSVTYTSGPPPASSFVFISGFL